MRDVDIVGAGITPFGKHPDATMSSLAATAIGAALADAGLPASEVDLLVHGNAMAGVLSGQEMIRGELAASAAGLAGVSVVNVENACATSSSALHVALAGIRSGMYDTAVVCGSEKMTGRPTAEILAAMTSGTDLGRIGEITRELTGSEEPTASFFMDVYARIARDYQARSGASAGDFADVAAKNSAQGALNPNAQYQRALTRSEVLASRVVAPPMTMLMCSPIADGAAALVLRAADRVSSSDGAVRIRACALGSGRPIPRAADRSFPACWLLAEWPPEAEEPAGYWLSTLPGDTPLAELVRLAKIRWRVEHDYRELKTGLGLDHFEGRSFTGWHRHVTLAVLAQAFCTLLRSDPKAPAPG